MRTSRFLVAVALLLTGAMVLSGCAGGPRAVPVAEGWRKLAGEWTNPEHSGLLSYPQRIVIKEGYAAEEYLYVTDATAKLAWTGTPRKSWTDAEGYTYCQVHFVYTRGADPIEGAALLRVDVAGQTLEGIWIVGVPASGKSSDWAFAQLDTWDPGVAKKLSIGTWLSFSRPYALYRRK